MTDRTQLTGHHRRVPKLTLESATGEFVSLFRRRRATILILIHDLTCSACRAYVESIDAERAELDSWAADIAIIVSDDRGRPSAHASPCATYYDPERRVSELAGVEPPGVVVVDQWGEATDTQEAGEAHAFPAVAAVVSWVRYLAVQCPECEGESL